VAYRVLEDIEKEVVLVEPEVTAPPLLQPPMSATSNEKAIDLDQPASNLLFSSQQPLPPADSEVPAYMQQLDMLGSTSLQPKAPLSSQPPVSMPLLKPKVIKTIKKLLVEVLCSQHNPVCYGLVVYRVANHVVTANAGGYCAKEGKQGPEGAQRSRSSVGDESYPYSQRLRRI
jgi:hypothetical protein